jgi:mono/diheme cytochrome c family protein
MKTRTFWAIAAAACLVACSRETPVEEAPAEAPAEAPPEAMAPAEPDFDAAFIDHMHAHADHMDEVMYALDDGDLESAASTAVWLSRHHPEDRVPDEWLPYLQAMQESARAVVDATDLDTARAAAEQVSVHCQECHAVAGVSGGASDRQDGGL